MSKAGKRSPAINKAIKSNVPGPDEAHKKLTLSDKQKEPLLNPEWVDFNH
jgi:hypothetical protein